jgi:hypothetical protein
MTIFAIIAPAAHDALRQAVQRHFPKNLEFSPGQFVVAVEGMTAQQVTLQIGGADGANGKFVVFSIAAYWGYHDKILWEWLTVNPG